MLIAALAGCVKGVIAAEAAEVLAMRRGLSLALEIGLSNVQVESDASNLIKSLQSVKEDFSDAGNMLEDCKMLIRNFTAVEYYHVRRQGNKAAHGFAKYGASIEDEEVWLEDEPGWARQLLLDDVHNFSS